MMLPSMILPHLITLATLVLLSPSVAPGVQACTNMLITPGASEDGSAIIAYNSDAPTLYGVLYHYKPTVGKGDEMRKIFNWDNAVFAGTIPEVNETYNVVGNSNEHGLLIGETTFGGVEVLESQSDAIMDYGSLMWLTLQRCKTVQEAIHTMVDLMDTYGYASEGESFSLADRTGQVWMMEVISRGDGYGKKGAVWVAQRIPDGMVAAHANQARIRTFPRNDPENCLYADDVVDVAVHYGLYPADADPLEFSFSDVYNPVKIQLDPRQGDSRVWGMFSKIADDTGKFEKNYLEYALGQDLKHRMPLYVKPYKKLAVKDVMHLMSSHFENTPLDQSQDVGGGAYESPYRPMPVMWNYQDKLFFNERPVAMPKTALSFISQSRPYMPPELASLVWFACDDSSTSPRVPIYGSSRKLSRAYYGKGPQDGILSPLMTFDLTKAFWVQNMVSNFAYLRWNDIYPVVKDKLESVHEDFATKLALVDQNALKAYNEHNSSTAIEYVTLYSINAGDTMHKLWMEFYGELFVRFRDFYTYVPKEDDKLCGCEAVEPGFSDTMKQRIIDETGDRYLTIEDQDQEEEENPVAYNKLNLALVVLFLMWMYLLVARKKVKGKEGHSLTIIHYYLCPRKYLYEEFD